MKKFVEEQISGEANLWDKMTKSTFLSWNSSSKEIKLQAKSVLKSSLFEQLQALLDINFSNHGHHEIQDGNQMEENLKITPLTGINMIGKIGINQLAHFMKVAKIIPKKMH